MSDLLSLDSMIESHYRKLRLLEADLQSVVRLLTSCENDGDDNGYNIAEKVKEGIENEMFEIKSEVEVLEGRAARASERSLRLY